MVGSILWLVNATASVPAGYRLYLPEGWARDRKRRRDAEVPDGIAFKTKWEIALELIDGLLEDDLPRAPVVADAGYGDVTAFRDVLTSRGLAYAGGPRGGAPARHGHDQAQELTHLLDDTPRWAAPKKVRAGP